MEEAKKTIKISTVIVWVLVALTFCITTSLLALTFQVINGALIEVQSIQQISQDWNVTPFTRIRVTNGVCNSNEEPVFGVLWKGTVLGCDQTFFIETYDEYVRRANKRKNCWFEIPPVPPVYQTTFFKQVICGIRGGAPFANVTRPDAQTLICPAGTSPCSSSTSPDNTVCYPSSQIPTSCPVTQIKFVSNTDNTFLNSQTWINAGQIGGMTLVYSKTFNALPISATYVGQQPCMQPDDVQTSKAATFYHLETQQPGFCDIDINNDQSVDSRFTYLGLQTNEFDVQSSSNVLQILRKQPRYLDYVPADTVSKANTPLAFYARSTIPWNLSCEKDGKTRQSVISVVDDNIEKNAGGLTNLNAIVAGGFVALFIFLPLVIPMSICSCTLGNANQGKKTVGCYAGLGGLLGAVWIGMGVMIIVYNMYADSFFAISEAKVKNMTYVNGCSDAFTKVNADLYAKVIADQESTMDIMTAFGWCLIGFGIALWLAVFISVCFACKGVSEIPNTPPLVVEAANFGAIEMQEPQSDQKNFAADHISYAEPVQGLPDAENSNIIN